MWKVINDKDSKYIVVTPEQDIQPHNLFSFKCSCNPKIMSMENGFLFHKPIIVHNSFNNMEKVEGAMARLGIYT